MWTDADRFAADTTNQEFETYVPLNGLALTEVDSELGAETPPSFSASTRYSYCFFSFTV